MSDPCTYVSGSPDLEAELRTDFPGMCHLKVSVGFIVCFVSHFTSSSNWPQCNEKHFWPHTQMWCDFPARTLGDPSASLIDLQLETILLNVSGLLCGWGNVFPGHIMFYGVSDLAKLTPCTCLPDGWCRYKNMSGKESTLVVRIEWNLKMCPLNQFWFSSKNSLVSPRYTNIYISLHKPCVCNKINNMFM